VKFADTSWWVAWVLPEALAFDGDFAAAGFIEVRP
jgi:hypothetical protein